jgi:flagellar hook-associated protein 2
VSTLFGTISTTDGLDVEGTIDGQVAGGSGQVLSAALGSSSEGLKMTIAGGALGARGTIAFSQGYADRLSKLIDGIIATGGVIKSNQAGLAANVKDIENSTTAFNARLVTIEKNYRAQFTALDVAISNMQSTSTYLTQQLAIIAAQSN